ncbi:unnamed protein product [Parajaminaea phylloscopi]
MHTGRFLSEVDGLHRYSIRSTGKVELDVACKMSQGSAKVAFYGANNKESGEITEVVAPMIWSSDSQRYYNQGTDLVPDLKLIYFRCSYP